MGFRSKGVCYDTDLEAMQHWVSQYPIQQGDTVYSAELGAQQGAGQFGYTMTASQNNSVASTHNVVVSFPSCTLDTVPLTDAPQASLLLIAALAFAAFAGFRTGFRP